MTTEKKATEGLLSPPNDGLRKDLKEEGGHPEQDQQARAGPRHCAAATFWTPLASDGRMIRFWKCNERGDSRGECVEAIKLLLVRRQDRAEVTLSKKKCMAESVLVWKERISDDVNALAKNYA